MHILAYKLKGHLLGRLIACVLIFAIIVPLVTLHYLNKQTGSSDFSIQSFQSRTKLDKTYGKDEFLMERLEELRGQIHELERIKLSLSNELRELESRRHIIQKDVNAFHVKAEKMKSEAVKLHKQVSHAKRALDILQMERRRLSHCPQLPHFKLPKAPALVAREDSTPLIKSYEAAVNCNLDSCFDLSRCSYGAGFSIYVYNPMNFVIGSNSAVNLSAVYMILKETTYITTTADQACIFVVLIGSLKDRYTKLKKKSLEEGLHSLPHWNKNGRNHLLLQLSRPNSVATTISTLEINYGMAILGQSSYSTSLYHRAGFDVIIPPLIGSLTGDMWSKAAPQLPAFRKHFISYEGAVLKKLRAGSLGVTKDDLNALSKESKDFYIFMACKSSFPGKHEHKDWTLCSNHKNRSNTLMKSTFSLIPEPITDSAGSWVSIHVRLIEALQSGAIPVVLTSAKVLPFGDLIDWKQAAIILPAARITELNTLLRTVSVEDIIQLRRQGRFLWENYFATTEAVVNTVLATVRTRLALPAHPFPYTPSPSVFTAANIPIINPPDPDVIAELPLPSPSFIRNLTMTVNYQQQLWNTPPGALYSFPSTPFDLVLPSSAPFLNSSTDFELINGGAGGTGDEFSKAQGGNYPKEQFTVVLLTYERELVLMEAIQRLVGLQYLNKVVVVWNSPLTPSTNLRWPDIGVPLHVIKTSKNSLNNRFIPYDVIETDAILSIDDDVELRHDEVLLAFRVWRENRDHIVGFPGRYHAWDKVNKRWTYESKHACELSLILTGAAFIHRYYMYLYTHWMQQTIRDKVDEYMNCEDIAMNFLVAHITRKPPIKVTSRWTFLCTSCPVTLWSDKSHFEERHKCINFFDKVYGYMPLLKTQYRADSVLFKTRIPSTESKCFKYV